MNTLDSHLTFIGTDEDTGRPRCGFLTELIDEQDFPILANLEGLIMTLKTASGAVIQLEIPQILQVYVQQGADFWIGNLGGSEEAWRVSVSQA